jgi:MraZ protein
VFTAPAFTRESADYTQDSMMHRRGRLLRRNHFATAYPVEPDKLNRILVPASLREYAGLSGKVTVIGVGECLEIWDPGRYAEELARAEPELEETFESTPRADR